jgi:hypothetical protein
MNGLINALPSRYGSTVLDFLLPTTCGPHGEFHVPGSAFIKSGSSKRVKMILPAYGSVSFASKHSSSINELELIIVTECRSRIFERRRFLSAVEFGACKVLSRRRCGDRRHYFHMSSLSYSCFPRSVPGFQAENEQPMLQLCKVHDQPPTVTIEEDTSTVVICPIKQTLSSSLPQNES